MSSICGLQTYFQNIKSANFNRDLGKLIVWTVLMYWDDSIELLEIGENIKSIASIILIFGSASMKYAIICRSYAIFMHKALW